MTEFIQSICVFTDSQSGEYMDTNHRQVCFKQNSFLSIDACLAFYFSGRSFNMEQATQQYSLLICANILNYFDGPPVVY